MQIPFHPAIHPDAQLSQPALWLIFQNDEILLHQTNLPTSFQNPIHSDFIQQQHYLGHYQQTPCFALQVANWNPATDFAFHPIRQSYAVLNNEDLFQIIGRAKQILFWDQHSQFCSKCGASTNSHTRDRAKECSACGFLIYPVIAPVMMALIWRENEILLGRPPNFFPDMYTILAGFAEPGETIEETLHREVKEEVGLTVKNLQYFGSQPWPFPSNLMLAFSCEYDSGEIIVDKNELEDARWFSIDALPTLPRPYSLSRKIIDWHLQRKQFK